VEPRHRRVGTVESGREGSRDSPRRTQAEPQVLCRAVRSYLGALGLTSGRIKCVYLRGKMKGCDEDGPARCQAKQDGWPDAGKRRKREPTRRQNIFMQSDEWEREGRVMTACIDL
jgi:hypothetical protein